MIVFLSVILVITILTYLYLLIVQTRRISDRNVYIVFYTFSLSLTTILILVIFACGYGFIDRDGHPHGVIGEYIIYIVSALLDFTIDIEISIVVLSLLILPQLLAYILSGLFGAALPVRLFPFVWKAMAWLVAKGFAFAGGGFLALGFSSLWIRFHPGGLNLLLIITFAVVISLLISFGLVWFMSDVEQTLAVPAVTQHKRDAPIKRLASRVHGWATRHRSLDR